MGAVVARLRFESDECRRLRDTLAAAIGAGGADGGAGSGANGGGDADGGGAKELTEEEAQAELKRIPAADRRAAVGDLKKRGIKWMGPAPGGLPTWNARLDAVRATPWFSADRELHVVLHTSTAAPATEVSTANDDPCASRCPQDGTCRDFVDASKPECQDCASCMLENVDTTSDAYQSDYCASLCPLDGKCDCNGPPPGCTTMADPDCTACRACRQQQSNTNQRRQLTPAWRRAAAVASPPRSRAAARRP